MSGVTKTHVQLGDSLTATNNFMITAQAADGTMKIARGNNGATTQDILTVATDGRVSLPQNVRTWQAVTRTAGQVYAAPAWDIEVNFNGTTSGNNVLGSVDVTVNGSVTIRFVYGGGTAVSQCGLSGSITIPANATYEFTLTNVTGSTWKELR